MALTQIKLDSGSAFTPVYNLTDKQVDSIIKHASHHRTKFDSYIISFKSTEHRKITRLIKTFPPRDGAASLGLFAKLPREHQLRILLECDIESVIAFRQASLGIRNIVDSFNEFPAIVRHAFKLLYALLRTGLAARHTLAELYSALTTEDCTFCGDFAGYMSILTWKRTCFACIHFTLENQLVCQATAKRHFKLTTAQMRQLPSLKVLEGTYCTQNWKYKARHRLVSVIQARQAAGTNQQDVSWLLRPMFKKYNFMGSCALPYYDAESKTVDRGVSCTACVRYIEQLMRRRRNMKDWVYDVRIKVFSREEFLEHFQVCRRAQALSSGILAKM
ncbi:hypothetical protein MN608_04327 [Microdochium nivale]|nr:hypothetical protein MN608_04327 [Microdochium nivale]